jgi:hypothetical protein
LKDPRWRTTRDGVAGYGMQALTALARPSKPYSNRV